MRAIVHSNRAVEFVTNDAQFHPDIAVIDVPEILQPHTNCAFSYIDGRLVPDDIQSFKNSVLKHLKTIRLDKENTIPVRVTVAPFDRPFDVWISERSMAKLSTVVVRINESMSASVDENRLYTLDADGVPYTVTASDMIAVHIALNEHLQTIMDTWGLVYNQVQEATDFNVIVGLVKDFSEFSPP